MRLSTLLFVVLAACTAPAPAPDASAEDAGNPVVVVPDVHVACRDRDPLRRPFFGDLHDHTRLSFDAAMSAADISGIWR